jgi:arylsulfatase A-like enzyme
MTGRYQTRFGHEFNPGGNDSGLPLTETMIAKRLQDSGYQTGLVGKWHLGSQPAMQPQQRGFGEFFGFLGGAHDYFAKNGILHGKEQVTELDHTTDAFGREAAAFIERHQGKPWFLYLAFNAVHTPMQATPERLAKMVAITDKQRRTYAAMMLAMDDAIGVVRAKLAATGQEQNTLVTFISDNGGPTMEGVTVNGSNNAPLRGSKRTTLEGGIRVPFLMSWPAKLKPGVYEKPVIQLDLTATALIASGHESTGDGVNLLPHLLGEKAEAPHDALYWRFGEQTAIRMGNFKLVRYDAAAEGGSGTVLGPKLYNLSTDIGEAKDLAAEMPDKVKELQAKWDTWNQGNVAPLWGGKEKRAKGKGGKGMKKKKKSAAAQ